jgi:hypothetical protein
MAKKKTTKNQGVAKGTGDSAMRPELDRKAQLFLLSARTGFYVDEDTDERIVKFVERYKDRIRQSDNPRVHIELDVQCLRTYSGRPSVSGS